MNDELAVVLVMASFFYAIVAAIKIVTENRTRRKLIEAHAPDDTIRALFEQHRDPPAVFGALKWGLVVGAIGIAFIIVHFFGTSEDDPITYGILFLFAGAGLVLYYALVRHVLGASGAMERDVPGAGE